MSYLGYTRHIVDGYLSRISHPRILEIGVDKGQTTLPLIHNLSMVHGEQGTGNGFIYVGVDIKMRETFMEQVCQMTGIWCKNEGTIAQPKVSDGVVLLYENNSLDILGGWNPELKFDLVMIDGDHNYHTVKNELKLLQSCTKPTTVFLCDDFDGRYAKEDLWYSEKEEYTDNEMATARVETEKSGVRDAILDFSKEDENDWQVWCKPGLDACLMWKPKFINLAFTAESPETLFPHWKLNFSLVNPEE